MGRKQHQSDKLYLTTREWTYIFGGKKPKNHNQKETFRRLPFDCCSLSFQPAQNPYCTSEGVIFDLMNIVPFLKKYGISPVTGKKMVAKDLTRLVFHKNEKDKYYCPITYKVFNENTHIVAIKPTGNIYSYDAVEKLNIQTRNFRDLLNDEPFVRGDIITIQDPRNIDKFNMEAFYHVRHKDQLAKLAAASSKKGGSGKASQLKAVASETSYVLSELEREYKPSPTNTLVTGPEYDGGVVDKLNSAHFSSGILAASFTSTRMDVVTKQKSAMITNDQLIYERVKKKGYIRFVTNLGQLNLELHSDMVPRTCENFFKHCQSGYYDDTIFHRSIKNFMIQGGDPTGTGKGGDSIWGGPFKDEFKPNLTHSGRGVLSMANSGKDTNKSQFFITYRSANHLDGKHSVFGRVVGGLETLDKMEMVVTTDPEDRPEEEIKILAVNIFVNPYEEAEEQLKKEREMEEAKVLEEEKKRRALLNRTDEKQTGLKVFRSGVGKYMSSTTTAAMDLSNSSSVSSTPSSTSSLPPPSLSGPSSQSSTSGSSPYSSKSASVTLSHQSDSGVTPPPSKKVRKAGGFGDFSSW